MMRYMSQEQILKTFMTANGPYVSIMSASVSF